MPSNRWQHKNELSGMFRGSLSHNVCVYVCVLLTIQILCIFIMASSFVGFFFYGILVCVIKCLSI